MHRMRTALHALLLSAAAALAGGCQLMVDFDRGRLLDAGADAAEADAAADGAEDATRDAAPDAAQGDAASDAAQDATQDT
jgi:hypothetical protein